jgi:hypothetical protein
MSIKSSADEWVRKGPTQAIVVIAALGIVVGGLVGLGVGYKVEQSRTKSDVEKLQKQLKTKAAATGPVTCALGQRVGKVTASSAGSITVSTKKGGTQTLASTAKTVFGKAVRGTIADVHSGLHVLVTVGGKEMIVLPSGSKLGRAVTSVGSDKVKIAKGNGAPAGSISTADINLVSKVDKATAADVKTDDEILAGGCARAAKTFEPIEVIILPADSGFTG